MFSHVVCISSLLESMYEVNCGLFISAKLVAQQVNMLVWFNMGWLVKLHNSSFPSLLSFLLCSFFSSTTLIRQYRWCDGAGARVTHPLRVNFIYECEFPFLGSNMLTTHKDPRTTNAMQNAPQAPSILKYYFLPPRPRPPPPLPVPPRPPPCPPPFPPCLQSRFVWPV